MRGVTTSLEEFANIVEPAFVSSSTHASGLGDISIRSKVKLFESSQTREARSNPSWFGAAMAAGFNLRVPTGDECNCSARDYSPEALRRRVVQSGTSGVSARQRRVHLPRGVEESDTAEFFFGSETSFALVRRVC